MPDDDVVDPAHDMIDKDWQYNHDMIDKDWQYNHDMTDKDWDVMVPSRGMY